MDVPATLVVLPWADPVIDPIGHDPRSRYVELFWLGVLGPTATLLLRRLADGLESYPDGFELDVPDLARGLGIKLQGQRRAAFANALQRTVLFGMAQQHSHGLLVRRRIPPLSHRQVAQLPTDLRNGPRRLGRPDRADLPRARALAGGGAGPHHAQRGRRTRAGRAAAGAARRRAAGRGRAALRTALATSYAPEPTP